MIPTIIGALTELKELDGATINIRGPVVNGSTFIIEGLPDTAVAQDTLRELTNLTGATFVIPPKGTTFTESPSIPAVAAETTVDQEELARLRALIRLLADNLSLFVNEHSDPGTEAFGALWEVRNLDGVLPEREYERRDRDAALSRLIDNAVRATVDVVLADEGLVPTRENGLPENIRETVQTMLDYFTDELPDAIVAALTQRPQITETPDGPPPAPALPTEPGSWIRLLQITDGVLSTNTLAMKQAPVRGHDPRWTCVNADGFAWVAREYEIAKWEPVEMRPKSW